MHRKVKIYEWKQKGNPPRQTRVKTGVGLFHQFGFNYEEFEEGPGNFSTAIVEMEDGKVRNIPVEDIEFIL